MRAEFFRRTGRRENRRRSPTPCESVAGVQLLDVDPGRDMNRTVVTFVGPPQAVAEAAFRAIAKAAQVIDMRVQQGSHPRLGATDVCPFIPVEGVTMEDCAEIARQRRPPRGRGAGDSRLSLRGGRHGPRAGESGQHPQGRIRGAGGETQGPAVAARFRPGDVQSAVRARRSSVPASSSSPTTSRSTRRDKNAAADIAFELREKGRVARSKTEIALLSQRRNAPLPGESLSPAEIATSSARPSRKRNVIAARYTITICASLPRNTIADFSEAASPIGKKIPRAGKFEFCKAIGWYAEAFRRAQISINLTNYRATPPHLVLEEARKLAAERGLVVTGSEIVGMIPFAAPARSGRILSAKTGPLGAYSRPRIFWKRRSFRWGSATCSLSTSRRKSSACRRKRKNLWWR